MSDPAQEEIDAQEHVGLKRGKSLAEMKAAERAEKEKIAPFAFEDGPKPTAKCLGLTPDCSASEMNNKNSTVAPFNYKE